MSQRHGVSRAQFAHLAYTSLFERIIPTATNIDAPYGSLVAVLGAAASRTITLQPSPDTVERQLKDAYHIGIVNVDGAFTINVTTPDGALINGVGTITIPAGEPGAFAICFFSQVLDNWIALTGCCAGGGGG
jgi:hypothetical protein